MPNSEYTRRHCPRTLPPRNKSIQASGRCESFPKNFRGKNLNSEQAKDAHVGVVKAFALPPKPVTPTLPTDLAADLSAYDAAEVTLATATVQATSTTEDAGNGADEFLSFLEQDLPKPEAHH